MQIQPKVKMHMILLRISHKKKQRITTITIIVITVKLSNHNNSDNELNYCKSAIYVWEFLSHESYYYFSNQLNGRGDRERN